MHARGKHRRTPSWSGAESVAVIERLNAQPEVHRTPSTEETLTATDDDTEQVSVQVYLRVRAHPDTWAARSLVVHELSSRQVEVKLDDRAFRFDRGGGESTSQEEVFACVGKPVCDTVMAGFNGTIFAYGQTGAGKTFTLSGPPCWADDDAICDAQLRGLTPRVLTELFEEMASRGRERDDVRYRCTCTFLQIYNDQITDLLAASSATGSLRIRESPEKGTYVEGAKQVPLRSVGEALRVLAKGMARRHVAATLMNATSSRSHAIFSIHVHHIHAASSGSEAVRTSQLSLVDLAGSERQQSGAGVVDHASRERAAAGDLAEQGSPSDEDEPSPVGSLGRSPSLASLPESGSPSPRGSPSLFKSSSFEDHDARPQPPPPLARKLTRSTSMSGLHSSGSLVGSNSSSTKPSPRAVRQSEPERVARLQEACKINRSLSALAGVIIALNGEKSHVPYRDSKLTMLLRDSIGGSARTWMVANVSPLDEWRQETLSTLMFAARAQNVRNRVRKQALRYVDGFGPVDRIQSPPLSGSASSVALWLPPADVACQTDHRMVEAEAVMRAVSSVLLLQAEMSTVESEMQAAELTARLQIDEARARAEAEAAKAAMAEEKVEEAEANVAMWQELTTKAEDAAKAAESAKELAVAAAEAAAAEAVEAAEERGRRRLAEQQEEAAAKLEALREEMEVKLAEQLAAQREGHVEHLGHSLGRLVERGRLARTIASWRRDWEAERVAASVAGLRSNHAIELETERGRCATLELELEHYEVADEFSADRASVHRGWLVWMKHANGAKQRRTSAAQVRKRRLAPSLGAWRRLCAAKKAAVQVKEARKGRATAEAEAAEMLEEIARLENELEEAREQLERMQGTFEHVKGSSATVASRLMHQSKAQLEHANSKISSATEQAKAAELKAAETAASAAATAARARDATRQAAEETALANERVKEAYEDARLAHAERAMMRLMKKAQETQEEDGESPPMARPRFGQQGAPPRQRPATQGYRSAGYGSAPLPRRHSA